MAAASPRRSDAQRPHPECPPAQPAYVLRGHAAQVHAARFVRHNSRLLTGDADGWVVLWDIATKRAVAVWHAHEGAVLGFGTWGEDNIISYVSCFSLAFSSQTGNAAQLWKKQRATAAPPISAYKYRPLDLSPLVLSPPPRHLLMARP